MESVDRSDPCSRCLPFRYCSARYLSTRNSETPSQAQRYSSEARRCPKWSHHQRHVDCNNFRTLEDVSHRAYRHRSELGSRLHLCGHLPVVHCYSGCLEGYLQLHCSAGRHCLQCSYPRLLAIHSHVYYHRYQRSPLVQKEPGRYNTRGIPNAARNDRGPSCHGVTFLDRMDCKSVHSLFEPHIWHCGVHLGRPVYHRKQMSVCYLNMT